jgi:hypothetical protein
LICPISGWVKNVWQINWPSRQLRVRLFQWDGENLPELVQR